MDKDGVKTMKIKEYGVEVKGKGGVYSTKGAWCGRQLKIPGKEIPAVAEKQRGR